MRTYTVYRPGRAPRALLAGLLSAVVPGAGQVYSGRWRRGLGMLAVTIAIASITLLVWLQGSIFLLKLLVRPDVLLALLAANAVVFAFHAHCAVDAYRGACRPAFPARAPSRAVQMGRVAVVATLLAFVAIPHVAAAYYGYRNYDLITSVFADDEPVSPFLAAATLPPPVTSQERANPAAAGIGTAVREDAALTGPAALARVQPAEAPSGWQERGRVTFLLLGGDAGPGRTGLRTDTMMVLSMDPKTERAALFGLPRNLVEVPFPKTAHTDLVTFPDILNALWGYATADPGLFPGSRVPGATALEQTIGGLLGLHIDYYAAVDLRGFVEVIDALGGVTVNVTERVYDAGVSPPYDGEPWIVVDLDPGPHRDGRPARARVCPHAVGDERLRQDAPPALCTWRARAAGEPGTDPPVVPEACLDHQEDDVDRHPDQAASRSDRAADTAQHGEDGRREPGSAGVQFRLEERVSDPGRRSHPADGQGGAQTRTGPRCSDGPPDTEDRLRVRT